MTKQINRYIKELLDENPDLGDVLAQAGIGCVDCSVGTCRLGDIIGIHRLEAAEATVLMQNLGKAIYGDQAFELPAIAVKQAAKKKNLSPPFRELVEEHRWILRVIARVPQLIQRLGQDAASGFAMLAETIGFIREYADHLHHAKEEAELFPLFDPTAEIIQAMNQDHRCGRDFVAAMSAAIETADITAASAALEAWAALLTGHIKREDEILYPWMDSLLDTNQVGKLYARFAQINAEFAEKPAKWRDWVVALETQTSP